MVMLRTLRAVAPRPACPTGPSGTRALWPRAERAVRVEAAVEAFVRARRADVHPYLADLAGYGSWWPGARSRPSATGAALWLRPPARLGRIQRLEVAVTEERPGEGVALDIAGALDGAAEWYYLDEADGTVVHYLLWADTAARGASKRVAAHRACVRAGLATLKGLLEAGRPVGAEPEATLRAAQRRPVATRRAVARTGRRAREEGKP